MEKRKIIIDTDPGHDDALAIMLIEKSGLFDILAVTTVAGNSTIQNTTNNARYVLDLIASSAPLYSGAASPLKKTLVQADVHGTNGLAGAIVTKQVPLTGDAVEKIITLVKDNPGQVSILSLGPQTNLAEAFRKDEQIIPLIREIVMMGGAIAVPGNKNRVAEFNIFVDPDAADIVFRTEARKILIPLDVCNDIFLTLDDFERLKGCPLHGPILAMMEHYITGISLFEKTTGAIMYDPLAAYFLINQDAFVIEPMDIRIETQSELTRGMTVADRREWGEKHPNILVARSADRKEFTESFLGILRRPA